MCLLKFRCSWSSACPPAGGLRPPDLPMAPPPPTPDPPAACNAVRTSQVWIVRSTVQGSKSNAQMCFYDAGHKSVNVFTCTNAKAAVAALSQNMYKQMFTTHCLNFKVAQLAMLDV